MTREVSSPTPAPAKLLETLAPDAEAAAAAFHGSVLGCAGELLEVRHGYIKSLQDLWTSPVISSQGELRHMLCRLFRSVSLFHFDLPSL